MEADIDGDAAEDESQSHSWQIRVTMVIDPSNFYAQFNQDGLFDHFERMQTELQTYCTDFEHESVQDLREGMTVLAYSGISEKWLRAEVMRTDSESEEVDLLYIDYGISELRSWDLVISAFDPKYLALPRMAYLCSLADVKPLAKSWISRAVNYFSRLLLGVIAQADVILINGDQAMATILTRIYIDVDSKQVAVSDLMLAEELALPADLPIENKTHFVPANDSDGSAGDSVNSSAGDGLKEPATDAVGDHSASPPLRSNFDSLFQEPAIASETPPPPKPQPAPRPDPKEHERLLEELKMLYGDELVRALGKDAGGVVPGDEDDHAARAGGELTLEQQIHKMRNRWTLHDSMSPTKSIPKKIGSRDYRSPRSSPSGRKTAMRSSDTGSHELAKKRPTPGALSTQMSREDGRYLSPTAAATEARTRQRLHGDEKAKEISYILRHLAVIVGANDEPKLRRSLKHVIVEFQTYDLDVNEFLKAEDLCNDVRSILDKRLEHPHLSSKLLRLLFFVQDHDYFSAAVSFAIPMVVKQFFNEASDAPRTSGEPISSALADLYNQADTWADVSCMTVRDLVMKTMHDWLSYVTRSTDASRDWRTSLYISCLEHLFNAIRPHVQRYSTRVMDGLIAAMREVVLSDTVLRSDKEIVLDLLMESRGWHAPTSQVDETRVKPKAKTKTKPVTKDKVEKDDRTSCSDVTKSSNDVTLNDVVEQIDDVSAKAQVTEREDDDWDGTRYLNVRLLLLELNLSQYLDEMKLCGIDDKVMTSPDIDLASLMRDFRLPAVVAKRVLLRLGRDLPDWLHTRLAEKDETARPNWSLYRGPEKPPPSGPGHMLHLVDFLPPEERRESEPLFPADPATIVVRRLSADRGVTRPGGVGAPPALDDVDSFPPLVSRETSTNDVVSASLVAPPTVTRVTNDTPEDGRRASRSNCTIRICDLAKEIINSSSDTSCNPTANIENNTSYSDKVKFGDANNVMNRKTPEEIFDTPLEKVVRTADTDKNWRQRDDERKSNGPRGTNETVVDRIDEKVDFVSLALNTGALEFKSFADEEADPGIASTGLNAFVDLLSEPVPPAKDSPVVTRSCRVSPRPGSGGGDSGRQQLPWSPERNLRSDEWFDLELATRCATDTSPLATKTIAPRMNAADESISISEKDGLSLVPDHWQLSPSAAEVDEQSAKLNSTGSDTPLDHREEEKFALVSAKLSDGDNSNFALIGSGRVTAYVDVEDELDADDDVEIDVDVDDDVDDDDDDDGITVILTKAQAAQCERNEYLNRMEKFVTKPETNGEKLFKGFSFTICTRCGSREHALDNCTVDKPILF